MIEGLKNLIRRKPEHLPEEPDSEDEKVRLLIEDAKTRFQLLAQTEQDATETFHAKSVVQLQKLSSGSIFRLKDGKADRYSWWIVQYDKAEPLLFRLMGPQAQRIRLVPQMEFIVGDTMPLEADEFTVGQMSHDLWSMEEEKDGFEFEKLDIMMGGLKQKDQMPNVVSRHRELSGGSVQEPA